MLAGIVALLLPAGERANMVCLGAALILWATSLAMVLRARQLAEAALVEG